MWVGMEEMERAALHRVIEVQRGMTKDRVDWREWTGCVQTL